MSLTFLQQYRQFLTAQYHYYSIFIQVLAEKTSKKLLNEKIMSY